MRLEACFKLIKDCSSLIRVKMNHLQRKVCAVAPIPFDSIVRERDIANEIALRVLSCYNETILRVYNDEFERRIADFKFSEL